MSPINCRNVTAVAGKIGYAVVGGGLAATRFASSAVTLGSSPRTMAFLMALNSLALRL